MRYIGNKTKLLPFILDTLTRLRIPAGTAHDAFSGTAAVGRALKARGWRVASSDIMTYAYVFQRAYVVAQRVPSFAELRAGDPDVAAAMRSPRFRRAVAARGGGALAAVAEYLSRWTEPERGFIATHYAPAGGRMYFTEENAERIDAARHRLHEWHARGLIGADAYYLLLAALIEGADRVANTAGVYAAYIKRWQPNAMRPVTLAPLPPVRGPRGSSAHQDDAAAVAAALGPIDLLYVDPPYNTRQYAGYYHVPEIIARGWFAEPLTIAGKTGLLAAGGTGKAQRSAWCSARRVEGALADLLRATGAAHVLVSYNSEGILNEAMLHDALASVAVGGRVRRFARDYRRYRADRDHARRRYRDDRLHELLLYARLR
ncbi:MAG TPA: DNA adenine methylase [Gemmatimonadaceae bacterium]